MANIIEAVYGGRVFCPTEPVTLEPNSHVRLSVEIAEDELRSFLDVAKSLELDGLPTGRSS
jgi:predicted DNA-binding antitoxin AbrB/MazE fold protein